MRKVVIIGAGHVGSHCGYALAHSGVASDNFPDNLCNQYRFDK